MSVELQKTKTDWVKLKAVGVNVELQFNAWSKNVVHIEPKCQDQVLLNCTKMLLVGQTV